MEIMTFLELGPIGLPVSKDWVLEWQEGTQGFKNLKALEPSNTLELDGQNTIYVTCSWCC